MSAFSNCQCDYRGGLVRFGVCVSLRRSRRENRVGGEVWGARISCGETLRVCRNVLCSDHACCLPHSAKQDGLRCVPFLFRRVEIAIHALSRRWRGYLPWRVHFGFVRFFMAISTGLSGMRGTGERGWRRGLCASLRSRIGTVMLSVGSTLGLRAPNLRQRVFDSLDSLHAAAGLGWCVYAPSPGYTERPARAQFGAG